MEGQLRENGPEGKKALQRELKCGWYKRVRMAGDPRPAPVFRPEGALMAPGEGKRSFVLSEGKFGRKIKTDLTCQASPHYSLLSPFLSVFPTGSDMKGSLVALTL